MEEERRVELEFRSGSSDKVYNMSLMSDGGNNWQVEVAYGKRWNPRHPRPKFNEYVTYVEADEMYNKILKQKTKKGYQIVYQS